GPSGSAADFTLPKNLRTTFSEASKAFATLESRVFQAFDSQPTRSGRALRSSDGEYVKAPLSMATVLRSFGSCPAIAEKTRAQSSALRASGPSLSIEGARA